MVIGGLKPDTTYSITVAAYTTKGDGARSKPKLVVTKGAGQCNHTLFSVMARLDDYCFFCYSDGRICSSHLRPEGRSGPEVFTQVLFHPTQKCVCHRAPMRNWEWTWWSAVTVRVPVRSSWLMCQSNVVLSFCPSDLRHFLSVLLKCKEKDSVIGARLMENGLELRRRLDSAAFSTV